MTVAEILIGQFCERPQGEKSAVLVDMAIWEQIMTVLEEIKR